MKTLENVAASVCPKNGIELPRSGGGVGVGMLRGAGHPFFSKFLDLEIDQDSIILKFVFYPKGWGSPIDLETPKFQKYSLKSH